MSTAAAPVSRCSAALMWRGGGAPPPPPPAPPPPPPPPHPPPASQRDAGDHFFVQRETCEPAGIAGQNLGRHHDVAGFQRGIEASGNAEADDASDGRGVKNSEQRPQLLRIAT